jgi:putative PIG3 family NAD(P)H quinone oxidoreductase
MRAVVARDKQAVIVDLPDPQPGEGELLVDVKATALNRADVLQVAGHYPPPPGAPETIGLEFAGNVVDMGPGVEGFAVGDRVMALVGGGGYAEKAIVHHEHALPVPVNLSDEEAAAIPEAFLTAYSNMVEIGGLGAGERVLIHAGASGVGQAAIQIARLMNATVIVTASAGKHDICRAMGADMTIDYKTENFADRILAEYSGVHLIIEMVGAPYWDDNMRVLEKWGRIVFVGLPGGAMKEVNFGQIMQKRAIVTGSTLRNRTHERKSRLIAAFGEWALPHLSSGRLQANVWKVMPLDEVSAALDMMRNNQNAGKIVLKIE